MQKGLKQTMNPIIFECKKITRNSSSEIQKKIADVANWNSFSGYGVLPGIDAAAFEKRTPNLIGSQVRVRNTDGSEHVETILTWESETVVMQLHAFTSPLKHLASYILEEWHFETQATATLVTRKILMFPTHILQDRCSGSSHYFSGKPSTRISMRSPSSSVFCV